MRLRAVTGFVWLMVEACGGAPCPPLSLAAEPCGGAPCPPLSVVVEVRGSQEPDAARLVQAWMSGVPLGQAAYYALYSPTGRLAEAGAELEESYRDAGYRDVVVAAGETDFAPGDEARIVFQVVEGRRFRFGTLTFEETPHDDEPVPATVTTAARHALERNAALALGEWYSGGALDDAILRVTEIYGDAGYARIRYQTRRDANQEQGSVDVRIRALPGPVYTIDAIEIVDAENGPVPEVPDSLVVGARFARHAVEDARAALQAAHPERRVEYSVEDVPEHPGHAILRFTMRAP